MRSANQTFTFHGTAINIDSCVAVLHLDISSLDATRRYLVIIRVYLMIVIFYCGGSWLPKLVSFSNNSPPGFSSIVIYEFPINQKSTDLTSLSSVAMHSSSINIFKGRRDGRCFFL